jgi:hypothetical protein
MGNHSTSPKKRGRPPGGSPRKQKSTTRAAQDAVRAASISPRKKRARVTGHPGGFVRRSQRNPSGTPVDLSLPTAPSEGADALIAGSASTLSTGSQIWACNNCDEVYESHMKMMKHRITGHGYQASTERSQPLNLQNPPPDYLGFCQEGSKMDMIPRSSEGQYEFPDFEYPECNDPAELDLVRRILEGEFDGKEWESGFVSGSTISQTLVEPVQESILGPYPRPSFCGALYRGLAAPGSVERGVKA